LEDKVIITAAITGGIHTPTMSPYLPITPEQIAEEALRAWRAGAAVAHIHVRDPETGRPDSRVELFREVARRIRTASDMVICFTTGGGIGMSTAERAQVVQALRPELASLNMGSMNFALFPMAARYKEFKYDWEKPYLEQTEDFIFANTFRTLREFAAIFREHGTRPELEIYDVGMLNNLAHMLERGLLDRPVYLQFVLGILGGIPATVRNLLFLYETARDLVGNFIWSVCAAGKMQMPIGTVALTLGGHVRVGLEDALYIARGELARSNAEQVEKIVRIARELGREPASPAEARSILGLKGLDHVAY
jgi:uncharacterized protein (DUF849 family)